MIINHNIAALNTHRQMGSAQSAQMNSMEKLSSGLRINSAKDDAAGLSISEKMRGQIRGLEQGSRNAQDGISMIQTAEGALSETQDILQRMREVSTQSANGTLTDSDRAAIQDEMNQLTSEMNRIGNTTEFNTQKLLQGDGKSNLTATGLDFSTAAVTTAGTNATSQEVKVTVDLNANIAANDTLELDINGKTFTMTYSNGGNAAGTATPTAGGATIDLGAGTNTNDAAVTAATADQLQKFIDSDDSLKGNFKVATDTNGVITIEALKTGDYSGSKGNITFTESGTGTNTYQASDANGVLQVGAVSGTQYGGTNTDATAAKQTIDLSSLNITDLVDKGLTINGQQIQFYNADEGTFNGNGSAKGIDISDVNNADDLVSAIVTQAKIDGATLSIDGVDLDKLVVTSTEKGANSSVTATDGGVQKAFKTSFQIGANTGQALTLEINDMRANALNITGKAGEPGFTATNGVTNGTDDVKSEASLNLMTKEDASTAIKVLDEAIASVSSERSKMGATQNRLEHTINNLNTSSENLTAAESRIRDVDYAEAA